MVKLSRALMVIVLLVSPGMMVGQSGHSYLGFDRNEYPGDEVMRTLRATFSFTGYWLNNPPGESSNSWTGKREFLKKIGYGFAVVFNGRDYAELRGRHADEIGRRDAKAAIEAARREGFSKGAVIFLDHEQGGRQVPEQLAHLFAWVDVVNASGYRAGVYCSGIPFREEDGSVIVTAEDIRQHAGAREIVYWVTQDMCPPSPGCVLPKSAPLPSGSGVAFAEIWQFAQSPRRPEVTRGCANTYSADRQCYAPGVKVSVDLSVSGSRDPSGGSN